MTRLRRRIATAFRQQLKKFYEQEVHIARTYSRVNPTSSCRLPHCTPSRTCVFVSSSKHATGFGSESRSTLGCCAADPRAMDALDHDLAQGGDVWIGVKILIMSPG